VLRPARARLRGLPGRGGGLRHGAPARAAPPRCLIRTRHLQSPKSKCKCLMRAEERLLVCTVAAQKAQHRRALAPYI